MEEYTNIFKSNCILVVEDDVVSQLLIEETLRITGLKIIMCSSAKEVYSVLSKGQCVDLILLDILLPEENGYMIATRLRKEYPELPIIAQTAYAMAQDRQKCLAAGCNDYLTKPIKPEILIDTLIKYLH